MDYGTVHKADQLVAYVDAGYAYMHERHSQTSFVFMLNEACVFAKSGRQSQPRLADSAGDAETIVLHEASHWVISYRRIMVNLGLPQECTTHIFEDNSAAETFARQGMGPRSPHYDLFVCT